MPGVDGSRQHPRAVVVGRADRRCYRIVLRSRHLADAERDGFSTRRPGGEPRRRRRTPIVPVRITESSLSGALQYLLQLSQWLDAFDVPVETCAAAILDRVNCPEPPEDLAPAALAFPATARASVAIQPGTLVGGDASYSVDFLGLRVGRTPDNDVVVGDPSVSRHHCTISATEDGFLLTDLHATNGTKVNGQLVSHWQLSDGDRLQVGDAEFRFAWPAP